MLDLKKPNLAPERYSKTTNNKLETKTIIVTVRLLMERIFLFLNSLHIKKEKIIRIIAATILPKATGTKKTRESMAKRIVDKLYSIFLSLFILPPGLYHPLFFN
jgi:hypothetical protein